ncbi:MAG: crossover junction endodeoxyribonuclease RuvC [Allomuricauda sp.]
MNILALDVATKTGWATVTSSGVWDLKPRHGESVGMRVIRFKAKLKELIRTEEIELISYERPSGRNSRAIQTQSELIGVLITLCHENNIEYASYIPSEIKRHATGKGNCNKEQMIEAAKKRWPKVEIIDDNQSDALWLLDMTKQRLT